MMVLIVPWVLAAALAAFFVPSQLLAQPRPAGSQVKWEKTLEAARKEGKVAISIPASAEMRKQLEENFKKRHGIGGSGNLAIIKSPAHPNATKVFVNWLLGCEGQEIVSKALGQATRRLDVDTKFLREAGVIPAKDHVSVKEFWQIENQSEEKLDKVRDPAQKFAQALRR